METNDRLGDDVPVFAREHAILPTDKNSPLNLKQRRERGKKHEMKKSDATSQMSPSSRGFDFDSPDVKEERRHRKLEAGRQALEKSARIRNQAFEERESVKRRMEFEKKNFERKNRLRTKKIKEKATKEVMKSPFRIDLVAETERIDEEVRVKQQEDARRMKELEKRKDYVKANIIQRALTEDDEMDVYRTRRRQMFEEQKNVRAMRDVRKAEAISRKARSPDRGR